MKYQLTTISRTLPSDLETPVGLYLKVRDLYTQSALLESSDYHTSQNSVSFIGVNPIASFKVENELIVKTYFNDNPITIPIATGKSITDQLRDFVESFAINNNVECNFNGLFGCTSYDAVRYFEKVNVTRRLPEFQGIPEMQYILYRYIIEVNHFKNQMTIIENIPNDDESRIDEIISIIHNHDMPQFPFHAHNDTVSTITDAQYREMVKRGIEHVKRGDVFQIVLSRQFSQGFSGDEFNVYRALRSINPSPYLFYFDFGAFKVFGSSPETHFRIKEGKAYIDPIAGTFKRTGNDARDHQLANELLNDPKENAEHIMLVDLARNDLARSNGTVDIEYLKEIQFYSHVIHMVSRVSATLPDNADVYRLFAHTFPAGTLSGAPKVKAMNLIDEIEPHSRMAYGGCIGYIGFNGEMNHAITIRSFLSYGNRLYSQAGAGIVASSSPENELQETNNKLGALNKAIIYAQEISDSTI